MRRNGCRPIFVRKAEPSAIGCEWYAPLFVERLVSQLLKSLLAENPNGSLVKQIIAEGGRWIVARDQGIRCDRYGSLSFVLNLVADGEKIFVVHRHCPAEFQAFAVLPGQVDRFSDGETVRSDLSPDGLGSRHRRSRARSIDPAELSIKRLRATGRREKLDCRGFWFCRFVILRE